MDSVTEVDQVVADQLAWAQRKGLPTNDRRTGLASLDVSLFAPLTQTAREQFASAPGSELKKMHSLRSSSALAVNVFMPWGRDPSPIAALLGGAGRYSSVSFEQPFPTGASARDPHLDVVLEGGDRPLAIESKFVEPYDRKERASIADAYFDKLDLWSEMDELRVLAKRIADDPIAFERLEAAQLVKHSLGLTKAFGPRQFRLVYLWYRVDGKKADQHQTEIDRFTSAVGPSIDLLALTYQELFKAMSSEEEPIPGYMKYLDDRYFGGGK